MNHIALYCATFWRPLIEKLYTDIDYDSFPVADLHKVVLLPANPDYSPTETELGPLVNWAVQKTLAGHAGILEQAMPPSIKLSKSTWAAGAIGSPRPLTILSPPIPSQTRLG